MAAALVVLVYDVTSDRRRNRLHQLLCEYGVPVQKSAFEARLTPAERKTFLAQVSGLVNPTEDSFIMYGVGKEQEQTIAAVGRPRPEVSVPRFFIV